MGRRYLRGTLIMLSGCGASCLVHREWWEMRECQGRFVVFGMSEDYEKWSTLQRSVLLGTEACAFDINEQMSEYLALCGRFETGDQSRVM